MPAKNLSRVNKDGIYLHIYNKGVENRVIFNDKEDYRVFLGYLEDYLTPPKDHNTLKMDFKVRGQTFRGMPHQPKNYLNQVELIVYSLMPDQFHLLVRQVTKGSVENFIRSLCTRYSIYFNKKYKRSGTLFAGPYKSAPVDFGPSLLDLTRFLHSTGDFSSYLEYLGKRKTSWVKSEFILTSFNKDKGSYNNETDNKVEDSDLDLKPRPKLFEFLGASTAIFVVLVALGIRNIMSLTPKDYQPLPISTPDVLSETTTPEAKPKVTVVVKVENDSSIVNIREEPTTNSKKIGQAKNGDTFELLSFDSGWYEVKLATGSAFISAKYIEEIDQLERSNPSSKEGDNE